MPATKSVASTNDQDINGVLSGIAWAVNGLTYSFPTSSLFYEYGSWPNFAALNGTQQSAVNAILAAYAGFANLSFTQVTESTSNHGDLRFAMSSAAAPTAFAFYPSSSPSGGDSWYDSDGTYSNPVKGSYAYTTFIHEIGHALGLKHGHETDTYGAMTTAHDSMEYSVMTYRSYVGASTTGGYTNETWGYAQTPMMYDIAALQHMYGANFNQSSGNTTYSWSATTGEMFVDSAGQGAPGGNRIFLTVWDGNGTDTYDFSNYSTNLQVDLRPGFWTTTSNTQLAKLHFNGTQIADGNIANALLYSGDLRSLIENAIGGSGNDSILGNQGNNSLTGNGGIDRLDGGLSTYTVSWGDDRFGTFTGDQRDDILQINADGKAYVWSSTGTSFTSYVLWGTGLTSADKVGDFNNDGMNDLIQFRANGTAFVWLSNGTSFNSPTQWGSGFIPADTVGDFNNDDRSDVIQLHDNGNAYVWFSNGTSFNNYIYAGSGHTAADKIGDFNGDGRDDVIQLHPNGNAYVWLANGAGFNSYGWWGSGFIPSDVVGDFNGDGKEDVIQLHDNGNAYVWFSNGASFNNYIYAGSGHTAADKIGDFNGDGKQDIIQLHPNGNAYVWLANGAGFNSYGWWGSGHTPDDKIADFDGDGKDDIVQLHPNGSAYVWLSNGTTFTQYTYWGTGFVSGESSGNDILTGGPGSDTFVFKGIFGTDIIMDFAAGAGAGDVIELDDAMFANFAAVLANTTDSGLDAVIHFADYSITIKNVNKAFLHSDDFSFV